MTIEELRELKVLITGGYGFLGVHLFNQLKSLKVKNVIQIANSFETNLTKSDCADNIFRFLKPDVVFHLAGRNGGIQYNVDNAADIFVDNTKMALNVLEACSHNHVTKVVSTVASCAYGDTDSSKPLHENRFLEGLPHPTVRAHGMAKRNLQLASTFMSNERMVAVCACPTTLYGPGDSFDSQRTKLVGAMVKRYVDAIDEDAKRVTCWGHGEALREVMCVEDAAKLLVEVMLKYENTTRPINLGTGQEYSIAQIARKTADAVKYFGMITWDHRFPTGQTRKRLDITTMRKLMPDFVPTPFEDGLKKTIEYYRSTKAARK